MIIKYSDWRKHITSISKDLGGHLEVIKRPSLGDDNDYLNSECSIEYKNGVITIEQLFIKSDYENGFPEKLNLKFEFEDRFDFFLSISERDYFDKIFGWNRIKLRDTNFDKKFTIQSNDKLIVKNIFSNLELRKLLLDNNTIILNVSSVNRKTKIVIKNMHGKIYTVEEYNELLSFMKYIIDCVKR